jgi:hypothetical protein
LRSSQLAVWSLPLAPHLACTPCALLHGHQLHDRQHPLSHKLRRPQLHADGHHPQPCWHPRIVFAYSMALPLFPPLPPSLRPHAVVHCHALSCTATHCCPRARPELLCMQARLAHLLSSVVHLRLARLWMMTLHCGTGPSVFCWLPAFSLWVVYAFCALCFSLWHPVHLQC